MQVRTYYYEIKLVEPPREEGSVGLQIEDFSRPQAGKLQTYKVFLIQVRTCFGLCWLSACLRADSTLPHRAQHMP